MIYAHTYIFRIKRPAAQSMRNGRMQWETHYNLSLRDSRSFKMKKKTKKKRMKIKNFFRCWESKCIRTHLYSKYKATETEHENDNEK